MATISDVPRREQDAAEESPAFQKFREAMGASRFARLMAVYILLGELDFTLLDDHETIGRYAKAAGTSPEAMRTDLRWAMAIPEEELRGAFAREGVPDLEWSERITLEHLRTITRASHPDGRPLKSEEMVAWLVASYHADESSAEFKDTLRKANLIRARPSKRYTAEDQAKAEEVIMKAREAAGFLIECMAGERGPLVREKVLASWQHRTKVVADTLDRPATATAMLRHIASALEEQEIDLDISQALANREKVRPGAPIPVHGFLAWLAAELRRDKPGAEFTLANAERGQGHG